MKYLTTRLHHPHTQKRGADLFCPRTSILLFRIWVQLRGLSAWWAEHVRQGNNIWQGRTEETRGWPRVHGQKAGQLVGIYHMWEGWRPSGASQPLSEHIKTRLWEDKVSSWLLLSRQSLNLLWTQPNTRDIMHKSHRVARNHADTGPLLRWEIEHTHGSSAVTYVTHGEVMHLHLFITLFLAPTEFVSSSQVSKHSAGECPYGGFVLCSICRRLKACLLYRKRTACHPANQT